jgi:hypothetical protein
MQVLSSSCKSCHSSSAPSTIGGNDPNRASCTSNPFQPSSNWNAFSHSNYTDVMLLSCTNNSLQQCISSSDSSSLIGLCLNLECNACAKANSYKVGNDSSEVGNDCTSSSSNKSASVDASNPSIPMPNSFKPSFNLSFKVSNVPLSKGCAMTTGPVVNLHLGSPERGDVSWRGSTAKCIGTRSSTMAVKALWLLQPAKGETVQVALVSTRRHQDDALWSIWSLPILLWFPQRLRSAWISLSGSRSSCCGERHSQNYTMHGEKIKMIIQRRQVSWIHWGC